MKTNENILDFAESEDICQCGNLTPEFVTKLINEYEEKLRWIPVDKLVNPTIPSLGKDENGKIELFKVPNIYYMKAIGIVEWRSIF